MEAGETKLYDMKDTNPTYAQITKRLTHISEARTQTDNWDEESGAGADRVVSFLGMDFEDSSWTEQLQGMCKICVGIYIASGSEDCLRSRCKVD